MTTVDILREREGKTDGVLVADAIGHSGRFVLPKFRKTIVFVNQEKEIKHVWIQTESQS
jgi:hypothetical protein